MLMLVSKVLLTGRMLMSHDVSSQGPSGFPGDPGPPGEPGPAVSALVLPKDEILLMFRM